MVFVDPLPYFADIAEGKVTADFRVGETIYRQGARAEAVHYLVSGRIKEIATSESTRKEMIVGLRDPGDFFGFDGLEREVMTCGAVAIKACHVLLIANAVIVRLLRSEPGFARIFVGHLLERNNRTEQEKIDLLFHSTEKRLALCLLRLAHYTIDGSSHVIGPEITQELLANMIGTTRPRVNSHMTKFRELGLIRYKPNDSIEITPRLQRVIEETGE